MYLYKSFYFESYLKKEFSLPVLDKYKFGFLLSKQLKSEIFKNYAFFGSNLLLNYKIYFEYFHNIKMKKYVYIGYLDKSFYKKLYKNGNVLAVLNWPNFDGQYSMPYAWYVGELSLNFLKIRNIFKFFFSKVYSFGSFSLGYIYIDLLIWGELFFFLNIFLLNFFVFLLLIKIYLCFILAIVF